MKIILENLDEQLVDIRSDPRLEEPVDDLENLFYAYLKTWIKRNTEILDILKKEKKIDSKFFLGKLYNEFIPILSSTS